MNPRGTLLELWGVARMHWGRILAIVVRITVTSPTGGHSIVARTHAGIRVRWRKVEEWGIWILLLLLLLLRPASL